MARKRAADSEPEAPRSREASIPVRPISPPPLRSSKRQRVPTTRSQSSSQSQRITRQSRQPVSTQKTSKGQAGKARSQLLKTTKSDPGPEKNVKSESKSIGHQDLNLVEVGQPNPLGISPVSSQYVFQDESAPAVQLLVHTMAPTSASQDAIYRKQAENILRGFDAASHIDISQISFGLPEYGSSIPDQQTHPSDSWVNDTDDDPQYYEDIEAMCRRYDARPILERRTPIAKVNAQGSMNTHSYARVGLQESRESIEDVLPSEEEAPQRAQPRPRTPSPSSTQYSSLRFVLPDVGSWDLPDDSIPESQDVNNLTEGSEVPSSPQLPSITEDIGGKAPVDELDKLHIPSSQPEESNLAQPLDSDSGLPVILTGDLTSLEFLTSDSQKGALQGKSRGDAGFALGSPNILSGSSPRTPRPAPNRSASSETPPTPLSGKGKGKASGGSDIGSSLMQILQERGRQQSLLSPQKKISREKQSTPKRKFRIEKASLSTPAQKLSQIEKATSTPARYNTRSKSRLIPGNKLASPAGAASQNTSVVKPVPSDKSLPAPSKRPRTPEYTSPVKPSTFDKPLPALSPQKPQTPAETSPVKPITPKKPLRASTTLPPPPSNFSSPPRRSREFFYSIPAPLLTSLAPLSPALCHTSQLPHSHQSTSDSPNFALVPLPIFSPSAPTIPTLASLVPEPHFIFPPDPAPEEVNTNPPQVTSYLARLVEKPHTWQPYYTPSVKKRDLREWERGCWVVSLKEWETRKEKEGFWEKLKGNVIEGRLGMVGVFLGEDDLAGEGEEEKEKSRLGGKGKEKAVECELGEGGEEGKGEGRRGTGEGGDIIKIYCWGKVVELLWAFLYVISNRKTKEGLKWVDAGGNVVIQC